MRSNHGIKDVDREVFEMLDKAATSYRIVLTKTDKIKATELDAVYAAVGDEVFRRMPVTLDMISSTYDYAQRADLILKKNANHAVEAVSLRRL